MWKYIVYWTISQIIPSECGVNEGSFMADFCDRRADAVNFYERQKDNEGYQLEIGIIITNVELDSVKID